MKSYVSHTPLRIPEQFNKYKPSLEVKITYLLKEYKSKFTSSPCSVPEMSSVGVNTWFTMFPYAHDSPPDDELGKAGPFLE